MKPKLSRISKSPVHLSEGYAKKPFSPEAVKSDIMLETKIQYFLASLIDSPICSNEGYLGIRYSRSTEVVSILHKIINSTLTANDVISTHPNALLSVTKEVMKKLPLSFVYEELIFSSATRDEIMIIYIKGILDTIPHYHANTLYLVCKALKKLSLAGVSQSQSLTDILISFTPLIFPRCCGFKSMEKATRTLLLMIEEPEKIFKTHIIQKSQSFFELNELLEFDKDEEKTQPLILTDEEMELQVVDYKLYHDTRHFYVLTFDEI